MPELVTPNPNTLCLLPGEIRERHRVAQNELAFARQNPYGEGWIMPAIRRRRHQMSPDVQRKLSHAVGLLLPLNLEEAVEKRQTGDVDFFTNQKLVIDVLTYMSEFSNTRVRMVRGDIFGGL